MKPALRAIVTVPPHADFLPLVAAHPRVAGLRLNTVMPIAESHEAVLRRLAGLGRPLWVDLKGRQLRVVGHAQPPFTEVGISHPIQVPTPCDVFFGDGREHARLLAVDGRRLVLEDAPRRVIGPGESINIVHPDLRIQGTLTPGDRRWLTACKETGQHRIMLSFVESPDDVAEVQAALPGAQVVLKIESQKGLALARGHGAALGRLMAARGDLYVEVGRPHQIIGALQAVLAADAQAIVASRILSGLAWSPVPECSEISDVGFLWALGYRTLMLGDQVCQQGETVLAALDLLDAIAGELDA